MFQESFPLTDKTCFLYGNPQSSHLLIQPVGAQDLSGGLEKEVACLKKMAGEDFLLAAFDIRNWNQELSPWEAPPVWGQKLLETAPQRLWILSSEISCRS